MAPIESYVGVAPDSTGKKIRNVQVGMVQADGTIVQVLMQVVSVVDENGNPIAWTDEIDWRMQLLDEIRAVRLGLQQWLDAGAEPGQGPQDDLLEQAQTYRDPIQET